MSRRVREALHSCMPSNVLTSCLFGLAPAAELSDSYFTPTAVDLKAAQDSLTARTQALVNAPLRTQAMRDEEQKSKAAKYPTVRVNIVYESPLD